MFLLFSFKHPFYLSVTDLKYNLKSSKFEGSVKLFTNDFEKALKIELKQKVDLLHPKDREQTRLWIEQYLNKHLVLSSPTNKLSIKVIGFENEEEATWTYVESTSFEANERVEVSSDLLVDQLPEQTNIVQLEMRGKQLNYKLNKSETSHLFRFEWETSIYFSQRRNVRKEPFVKVVMN